MKYLTILIFAFVLAGCGGDDNESSETTPETGKNLFSYWSDENSSFVDLTGGDFSQRAAFNFFLNDGSECTCDFLVFGGQTSGSYVLNSCEPANSTNFQCESFNQTGTYSNTNSILTITNSNGSFQYR